MYVYAYDDGDIVHTEWIPVGCVSLCAKRPLDSIRNGKSQLVKYYNQLLAEKL